MALFKKNVDLLPALQISSFRKIALGTWQTVGDPSVYGIMELEVRPTLKLIEELRAETGQKITITHIVGKAIANAIAKHPEINCILRWGRLYPRKTVDVHYLIASDDQGKDLTGTTIREADKKSVVMIATELSQKAKTIRATGDQEFKKVKKTMKKIPGLVVRHMMNLTSFILYTLNIWSPLLGSPQDPFGSVIITNIGSLGLDTAFVPLVPYSRVPLLLAVSVIKEQVVVKEGKMVIEPVVRICATFDHRMIDGMHASHICKTIHKMFAQPEVYLHEHTTA